MVIQHWNKLGRWKSSIRGWLMRWLKKKFIILKCHLLLFYATTNHSSIGLCLVMESRFYMTTSNDKSVVEWGEAPKHFPKPNLHSKKVMVTLWWFVASLNPSETIMSKKHAQQTNEMHWKLQDLQLASERAQFFSATMLYYTSQNQCFQIWTKWAMKFCLICHIHLTSHQLTITSSSILTTLCRENTSTTNRMQKMLSKSLLNPKAWVFMLQE